MTKPPKLNSNILNTIISYCDDHTEFMLSKTNSNLNKKCRRYFNYTEKSISEFEKISYNFLRFLCDNNINCKKIISIHSLLLSGDIESVKYIENTYKLYEHESSSTNKVLFTYICLTQIDFLPKLLWYDKKVGLTQSCFRIVLTNYRSTDEVIACCKLFPYLRDDFDVIFILEKNYPNDIELLSYLHNRKFMLTCTLLNKIKK